MTFRRAISYKNKSTVSGETHSISNYLKKLKQHTNLLYIKHTSNYGSGSRHTHSLHFIRTDTHALHTYKIQLGIDNSVTLMHPWTYVPRTQQLVIKFIKLRSYGWSIQWCSWVYCYCGPYQYLDLCQTHGLCHAPMTRVISYITPMTLVIP